MNQLIADFLVDRTFQGIILGIVSASVLGAFLGLQGSAYLGFMVIGCIMGILWATGVLTTLASELTGEF